MLTARLACVPLRGQRKNMGSGHSHNHSHDHGGHAHGGHSHDHTAGASRRQLTLALLLTGGFLIVEFAGAWLFNSLALLSDAAHMFTDTAALAIALAATHISARPADDKRTFGYKRFEILAAAFNAVLLFFVAAYIFYEAVGRFLSPAPVQSIGMLVVAALGLVVNLIAMSILSAGKDDNLNIKGAYLEVWADALGSIGVIFAAGAIWMTGWSWVDPVVAVLIALWVLPRTWILLRDTTQILLEGVPGGMDLAEVRSAMTDVAGVKSVHDLHIWAVGSKDMMATAHVEIHNAHDADAIRIAVAAMLEARYHLHHVTIQTEREACAPHEHVHP